MEDKKKPNQDNLLSKLHVNPQKLSEKINIEDLVSFYSQAGAFQGGKLAEACQLLERIIDKNCTITLTLAGAMTPAGMGGAIISMIDAGLIDMIISTGANLYHDLHFALGLSVYKGDSDVDDTELYKQGIERIHDVFITEKLLLKTDKFIQKVLKNYSPEQPISTADLHYIIGKIVSETTPHPEKSILASAYKNNVPIFTSSPGDSSIGMNLAALSLTQKPIITDPNLDVLYTTAIIYDSPKNAAVIVGGGSPKNFFMQTQPMLKQIFGIDKGGHDYDIQISVAVPQFGGLSGATPKEAVSWGKVKSQKYKNSVTVYCDATISIPILFSYILAKGKKRQSKFLYTKLPQLVKKLKKEVLEKCQKKYIST